MCTISAIKLSINVYFYLKMFLAVIVLFLGFSLGTYPTFKEAYGNAFDGYGFLVIMLACFSGVAMIMQRWATRKHNRFLLFLAFVFDTVCLAALLSLGLRLIAFTVSPFPADLKADCLLHKPTTYTNDECLAYLSDARTVGFRIVWASLYYAAQNDVVSFQIMTNIQTSTCCGFFPPMNCTDNSSPFKDPFPSTYYLSALTPQMASQHTQCGPYPGFYKQEDICVDYYDAAALIPIIGGCRTDMGVSTCVKDLSLAVEGSSKGCADLVETYVSTLILPVANFIIISTAFNAIAMLYACCLLWKRKETDVFPEVLIDMSKVKDVNYKDVPNQFAVLPTKSVLSKRGFLPKTEDEIYEERLLMLARRRAEGLIGNFDDLESSESKLENGTSSQTPASDEQLASDLTDLTPTPDTAVEEPKVTVPAAEPITGSEEKKLEI